MSPKSFRLLIIATWVVEIIALIATFALEGSLPKELQPYLAAQDTMYEKNPMFWIAYFLLAFALLIAILITDIGLCFFKPWAKKLLPCLMVAGLVLGLFLPPTVEHSVVTALLHLGSVMTGAIFALVYFSPLAERFKDAPRLES